MSSYDDRLVTAVNQWSFDLAEAAYNTLVDKDSFWDVDHALSASQREGLLCDMATAIEMKLFAVKTP